MSQDGRAAQATPFWMDVTPAQPQQARTGVTAKSSGWHTLFFFGLIIVAVGAAGFLGIAMWGPEKPIKSKTRLATDPPAPMTLPSLSVSEEPSPPPAAEPSESAEAAPAAAAPADSASTTKSKKKPGRGPKRR